MKTHFAILFKSLFLGTITPVVISCTHGQTTERLLPYIDTRMGTAASITHTAGMFGKHTEEYGQTLPAVLEPNGMNFWTPQTQDTEQKCIAPYYYRDSLFQGFRNSHWITGGCTQDYGSMTLSALFDSLRCIPEKRGTRFAHEQETATPSYYSVTLPEEHLQAEMTGRSRSAIFRFTRRQEKPISSSILTAMKEKDTSKLIPFGSVSTDTIPYTAFIRAGENLPDTADTLWWTIKRNLVSSALSVQTACSPEKPTLETKRISESI